MHPNKVRAYAQSKGWLAKTDYIDSKLLSDYANLFALPIKQNYNSENQEQLHTLIQRREQLILFKKQETNWLEKCYSEFTRESIKQHL